MFSGVLVNPCVLYKVVSLRTRQAAVLPWQVAVCAVDTGMLPPWVSKAHKVSLGADAPLDIFVQIFMLMHVSSVKLLSWVFFLMYVRAEMLS